MTAFAVARLFQGAKQAKLEKASPDKQASYSELPRFQALRQRYPRQCTLKLLGTHEKFLACDRTFAVLGSHNFLSAGPDGKQREIGIFTTDPYIIQGLTDCFDKGAEIELSSAA